eukprot:TRINITY_DN5681_c0_g1_i1.p1 TRINITY_DN5681_c0_g1~~TRINITY_DN5681_c0_g1_i1.p1  ORF type:complete len:574 (-),score=150.91 TRINITY_DN5681_c0_g1_i1:105-1826(-)
MWLLPLLVLAAVAFDATEAVAFRLKPYPELNIPMHELAELFGFAVPSPAPPSSIKTKPPSKFPPDSIVQKEVQAVPTGWSFTNLFTDNQPDELPGKAPIVSEAYDVVVNISSLANLVDPNYRCWEIVFNPSSDEAKVMLDTGFTGSITAVVGLYNKGKTWFFNRLAETYLPEGYDVTTEGLSFKKANSLESVLLVDSVGRHSPVRVVGSDAERHSKSATESLINQVLLDIADYMIIVVNELTFPDQLQLSQLLLGLVERKKQVKEIVVVHNWKSQPLEAVEKLFKKYVEPSYPGGSVKRIKKNESLPFYYSSFERDQETQVLHLFMVRESDNKEDVKNIEYNDKVFGFIRNWFDTKIAPVFQDARKQILLKVLNSLNRHLPLYLTVRSRENGRDEDGSDAVLENILTLDQVQLPDGRKSMCFTLAHKEYAYSVRKLPDPDIFPIPKPESKFFPKYSRIWSEEHGFIVEIEVPGHPPCEKKLSISDLVPGAVFCGVEISHSLGTFSASGEKVLSKWQHDAPQLEHGPWDVEFAIPQAHVFKIDIGKFTIKAANGVISLVFPIRGAVKPGVLWWW